MSNTSDIYANQVTSAILENEIESQKIESAKKIFDAFQKADINIQNANEALSDANACAERVRDFASNTERILGSNKTKHGEIAEQIDVEIRNAKSILNGEKPTATFDGVGRTAPEDYIINGRPVQSKFINGEHGDKSLRHVLDHFNKYPNFVEKQGYYVIPKDQYETLQRVANGERIPDMKNSSLDACKRLINQIEKETGKPFNEVVKPSLSNYGDVQTSKVDETLDAHEEGFQKTHDENVKNIKKQRDEEVESAKHLTDASWSEALKYSAISAGITAVTTAGINIYIKIKSGKKISEFTVDDWKDIGYDFAKGGIKGGISGLGIYGLTKLAGFSAPFASATVSTAMGIASLAKDYHSGKISANDFSDAACSLSVEAGISAIGAVIGQCVIPIPVLGSIVGSAVSKAALELTKRYMNDKDNQLIKTMQEEYDKLVDSLDTQCRSIINEMEEYYTRLGGFIEAAMSKDSTKAFYASQELCRYIGVQEKDILHDVEEVDDFMTN